MDEQEEQPGNPLRQRVIGSVLALSMNHPPVNALSASLRVALGKSLDQAESDPAILSVLLTGDDRLFSAGADITEFGQSPQAPSLADLCTRIEGFAKPVIAAVRGQALGGGLELALAAHYRLADARARLGFPEITLGLVPGAGGTQRLPRLVGAEQALRMILTGKTVSALEALAAGLVDHVHENRLMPAAVAFAQNTPAPRPTRDLRGGLRDVVAYQAAVLRARKAQAAQTLPAPLRAVECVEAALLLPFDQALAYERSAFDDLVTSPESAALRYLFRVERRVSALPAALAGQPVPPVERLAIWGAGEDSAELAARALAAGMQVTLADPRRDDLVAALRWIADRAERQVAAGHLTPEARDADWARLTSVLTGDGLGGADVIVMRPGAPPLPMPGADLPVVGLGPLSSVGGVGLALGPDGMIELAIGPQTPAALAMLAAGLVRRIGGWAVWVGAGGTVLGRLRGAVRAARELSDEGGAAMRTTLAAMANEGAWMLAEGTAHRPADIDVVAVASGLVPRHLGGPMYQADLRGLLVLRADLGRLAARSPGLLAPAPLFNQLIENGKRLDSLNG